MAGLGSPQEEGKSPLLVRIPPHIARAKYCLSPGLRVGNLDCPSSVMLERARVRRTVTISPVQGSQVHE